MFINAFSNFRFVKYIYIVSKIFILFFLIVGCSNKHADNNAIKVRTSTFSDTLNAHIYSFKKMELLDPRYMYNVNDKYIVVMDQRSNGIFKVMRLPDCTFLYSWGRMGKGPDEFRGNDLRRANLNKDQLIQFKKNLKKLIFYTITDTGFVYEKELTFSYPIPIGRGRIARWQLLRVNDSLYFQSVWNEDAKSDKEFAAYAPPDSLLYKFGNYPKTKSKGEKRFREFRKASAVKPDESKFVVFYIGKHHLKIYNKHGALLTDRMIEDSLLSGSYPIKHVIRNEIKASENYIYVLAYSTQEEQIGNVAAKQLTTSIEIWNWDGDFIDRFMLDKNLSKFVISEKYKTLYGFWDAHPAEIYAYDLSNML